MIALLLEHGWSIALGIVVMLAAVVILARAGWGDDDHLDGGDER